MNTIVLRIADFLKNIPPFSFLTEEEQLLVARSIKVEYFDREENIFFINSKVEEIFYLVREGAVGLYSNNKKLTDACDEGDIFGLRALIRQDDYKLTAQAIEETILYTIPAKVYKEFISKNIKATAFILQRFANNWKELDEEVSTYSSIKRDDIEDELSVNYSKIPVTCLEDTIIKDAAQIMTQKRVGSIVIIRNKKPIGIITDKDLRIKIATGKYTIQDSVTKIMSKPVICYPKTITVVEAQIAMLKNKITHLCITKDGNETSELLGVLSEHDIILAREDSPSALIKEIKRSYEVEQLVNIRKKANTLLERYLQRKTPIVFVMKIISEINNALTNRAITLAINEFERLPPVSFSWIALGSQGRGEQVLLTDQDNAIVFNDTQNNDEVRHYFLSLAKKVTYILNCIGFEYCPANMMASNPNWCLSLSEWKLKYKNWITKPTEEHILFCTIFFDFQVLYGDDLLSRNLMKHIHKNIDSSQLFLKFMSRNALQNAPPLGFFRQFLVEQNGEHKERFDIKARAMMPFVDAVRVLCLDQKLDEKNTLDRCLGLQKMEPQNKYLYTECYEAFKNLLQFRTEQGFENSNSGRFIDLSKLTKIERMTLKHSFKTLKELQSLIQVRFQLSNFM